MNQILNTNYNNINNKQQKFNFKKINFFRVFFFISLIFLIITIIIFYYNTYYQKNNQSISDKIIENHNMTLLYSNNNSTSNNSLSYNNTKIIGFIEISKLNIYYPIFNDISDELLKISPCRFSGPLPNQTGNLCIAGHNYDNYKFFSRLYLLKTNDEIKLYDTNGNKTSYFVFNNYEVNSSDLSPLTTSTPNTKELTLVTCNNFNSNRIIIKAKA